MTRAVETAKSQLAAWKEQERCAEEELFDGELKRQFLEGWGEEEENSKEWMEDEEDDFKKGEEKE